MQKVKTVPGQAAVLRQDLEALNDDNRLRILLLLKKRREICVCEIFEALDLPQNLVSYHLAKLKESGFIRARKEGVKVIYCLQTDKIKNFQNLINNLF